MVPTVIGALHEGQLVVTLRETFCEVPERAERELARLVGGEILADAHAGQLLVGDVVQQAVNLRLGVEDRALGARAQDVEENEGGHRDDQARHGGDEHLADLARQRATDW